MASVSGTDVLSPRIFGTELEYGFMYRDSQQGDGSLRLTTDSNNGLRVAVPPQYSGFGDFICNAARLYWDGYHPEYAAPECIKLDDLVALECAGDDIMAQTMGRVVNGFEAGPAVLDNLHLNRRVSDYQGNSWGYHENYSSEAALVNDTRLVRTLGAHLATRTIYSGTGALDRSGAFVLGQKAQHVTSLIAASSNNCYKPLIIDRPNDHHADLLVWGRINVVGGDPNMSPWATKMKVGTTLLVLDLISKGYSLEHILLRPGAEGVAASRVARDLSLRQTIELADGATATALEVQTELCAAAEKMAEDFELGPDRQWVLGEWKRTLTVLGENGPAAILDRADWPMRLQFLQTFAKHAQLPSYHPRVRAVDLRWDSIVPTGIGKRWQQKQWRQWMPPEELIDLRRMEGPQDTRAAIRSKFIHALKTIVPGGEVKGVAVDWSRLVYGIRSNRNCEIKLPNPYASANGEVEALLQDIMSRSGQQRIVDPVSRQAEG